MAQDVVIYTSNTCAYCQAAKEFFQQKEVNYQEINLDEQPDKRQELVDMSGQMAVPVTVVTKDDGGKEIVVGFDAPKLTSLLGV